MFPKLVWSEHFYLFSHVCFCQLWEQLHRLQPFVWNTNSLFSHHKEMPVFGSVVPFSKETRRWLVFGFFFFLLLIQPTNLCLFIGEERLLIFTVIIIIILNYLIINNINYWELYMDSLLILECWLFFPLHQCYSSVIYSFLWPHGSLFFLHFSQRIPSSMFHCAALVVTNSFSLFL